MGSFQSVIVYNEIDYLFILVIQSSASVHLGQICKISNCKQIIGYGNREKGKKINVQSYAEAISWSTYYYYYIIEVYIVFWVFSVGLWIHLVKEIDLNERNFSCVHVYEYR